MQEIVEEVKTAKRNNALQKKKAERQKSLIPSFEFKDRVRTRSVSADDCACFHLILTNVII